MAQNRGDPTQAFWAKRFLASAGSAALPSLSFDIDKDTGFYRSGSNVLAFAAGGSYQWQSDSSFLMTSLTTGKPSIMNSVSSSVIPIFAFYGDTNTGIGRAAADALSLIAGGAEGIRLTEAAGYVLRTENIRAALTADVGSVQGGTPLISSNNIISVCANAGDAVTLPGTFAFGTVVKIKNNGALSCDVFPASGDDLGAGANTAAALAAGASITYIGTTANAIWTSIGN